MSYFFVSIFLVLFYVRTLAHPNIYYRTKTWVFKQPLFIFQERIADTFMSAILNSNGADYGARTRHLDLGKVALYQMS